MRRSELPPELSGLSAGEWFGCIRPTRGGYYAEVWRLDDEATLVRSQLTSWRWTARRWIRRRHAEIVKAIPPKEFFRLP